MTNAKFGMIFLPCCLLVGMTIGNALADIRFYDQQKVHNAKVEAELKYLHSVAEKF